MRTPSASKRTALCAAALALLILVAYRGSFSGAFVLDDLESIAQNPTIRSLWPISDAFSPPSNGITVSGRPLLNASFALNYAVGGLSIGGYHGLNLLIHVAAALALFGIIRRTLSQPILKDRFGPVATALGFAVSAIWAVHPLQTESVTYVVQRAESLMGLFYLLTLYGFIRGAAPGAGQRQSTWLGASFAACLCGMATKEVMVSAPLIVFFYDRSFVAGSFAAAWKQRRGYYLGLGITWLLLAVLVATNGNRGGTAGFGIALSAFAYGMTQFDAVSTYLRLSIWPHPLIFDYGTTAAASGAVLAFQVILVVGLVAGSFWCFAQSGVLRALGFAGLWFFAILAPTSLVPGNRQTLAEHRMYLALIPVVALALAVLYGALARVARKAAVGIFLAATLGVALALGEVTNARNVTYQSSVELWRDTVTKTPGNPFAQNNLGDALQKEGKPREAIGPLEEAVRLKPDSFRARSNLGGVLAAVGRYPDAIVQCEASLKIDPNFAQTYSNLGLALAMSGHAQEAISNFQTAIRLDPQFTEARFNLGDSLLGLGRTAEAAQQFEVVTRLTPDNPSAYNNLGYALAGSGHFSEAIAACRKALALNPAYGDAHFNLANALFNSGNIPGSIPEFEEALRLKPQDPQICYASGIALAQVGRLSEAAQRCQRALQLRPDFPEARAYLDRIQAALGNH